MVLDIFAKETGVGETEQKTDFLLSQPHAEIFRPAHRLLFPPPLRSDGGGCRVGGGGHGPHHHPSTKDDAYKQLVLAKKNIEQSVGR